MRDVLTRGISPENEQERINNLSKYMLLHTDSEPIFDQIAALTAKVTKARIAILTYIDNRPTLNFSIIKNETDNSFCSIAFQKAADQLLNKIEDPCLLTNPLIASEYGLRFYAAVPVSNKEGLRIGTLCILDDKAREFTNELHKKMERIAVLAEIEVEKKKALTGRFSIMNKHKKIQFNSPQRCYF